MSWGLDVQGRGAGRVGSGGAVFRVQMCTVSTQVGGLQGSQGLPFEGTDPSHLSASQWGRVSACAHLRQHDVQTVKVTESESGTCTLEV